MIKLIGNNKLLNIYVIPFIIGSLSIISFAPFNFTIINFLIFPVFFFLIYNIKKKSKSKYRKKPYLFNLFLCGYMFGIGFFLTGNYWISNSLTFDDNLKVFVPLVIILTPLLLGVFFGLASLITGILINKDFGSLLIFSAVFGILDFTRGKIFTGFPWNLWSYSFSWSDEILQIIHIFGVYAFNLLVITLYLIPSLFFFNRTKKKTIISLTLILSFSFYIYGNYRINQNNNYLKDAEKNIYFKIISPNFDINYNLTEEEIEKQFKKIIRYSAPEKDKKTIFIWPEGVFSGYYFNDLTQFRNLIKKNFSDNHVIVFGVNTYNVTNEKTFNSLVAINSKFEKIFQYNKIKLVPFGEFLPLEKYFEKAGIKKITEGYGSFSKGKKMNIFNYGGYKILPTICYEIIFPGIFQKSRENKNIIINLSEDGWFGKSIGPYQHFAKAKFRAIESDSYLLRAANRGVSAIINNRGKIEKSLQPKEAGSIESKIPLLIEGQNNKNDLIFFILLITYSSIFFYNKNE